FEGLTPLEKGWQEKVGKIFRLRYTGLEDGVRFSWIIKAKLADFTFVRIKKDTSLRESVELFSAKGSGETVDPNVEPGTEYGYEVKASVRGMFGEVYSERFIIYVKPTASP